MKQRATQKNVGKIILLLLPRILTKGGPVYFVKRSRLRLPIIIGIT